MKDGRQTGISHTRISVPDISLSSLYRRYCSLVRYVGCPTPQKIPFKTHVFTYYFRYIVLTADFQTREHNRSLFTRCNRSSSPPSFLFLHERHPKQTGVCVCKVHTVVEYEHKGRQSRRGAFSPGTGNRERAAVKRDELYCTYCSYLLLPPSASF